MAAYSQNALANRNHTSPASCSPTANTQARLRPQRSARMPEGTSAANCAATMMLLIRLTCARSSPLWNR